MDIDWSKAPEGATHFDPVDQNWLCEFGGKAFNWLAWPGHWVSKSWQYPDDLSIMPRLVARPAWNGEGLPPVGIECEYLWQWSDKIVYVRIKVLSHDEERAQFRVISGGGIGSLRECNQRFEGDLPMFRPIRTPGQIAAEERSDEVRKMMALNPDENPNQSLTKWLCEALYDAGYRKQVSP